MKVLQPEAALCSTAWRTDGKAAWKKRRGGRKVSRSETLVEIPQNRERESRSVHLQVCVFACCLVSFYMFLSKLFACSAVCDEPK